MHIRVISNTILLCSTLPIVVKFSVEKYQEKNTWINPFGETGEKICKRTTPVMQYSFSTLSSQ